MTAQADRLARKALGLLQRFGQAATLTRRTPGAYNPATSTSEEAVSTHPVRVLVQADSTEAGEGDSLAKGSAVRASRRKLQVAASGLGVVPGPGDEVGPLEGRTWRVLETLPPVQLGGTPILYVLRVAA